MLWLCVCARNIYSFLFLCDIKYNTMLLLITIARVRPSCRRLLRNADGLEHRCRRVIFLWNNDNNKKLVYYVLLLLLLLIRSLLTTPCIGVITSVYNRFRSNKKNSNYMT